MVEEVEKILQNVTASEEEKEEKEMENEIEKKGEKEKEMKMETEQQENITEQMVTVRVEKEEDEKELEREMGSGQMTRDYKILEEVVDTLKDHVERVLKEKKEQERLHDEVQLRVSSQVTETIMGNLTIEVSNYGRHTRYTNYILSVGCSSYPANHLKECLYYLPLHY